MRGSIYLGHAGDDKPVAVTLPSDEGSLPEIALSDASKLASTYVSLFYRSVHVLYTVISK